MASKFVVKIGRELLTFDRFEDIPDHIDRIIEFLPEVPPAPHSHEQHLEIEAWQGKLMELLRRENASRSQER
jgi:hypothetical protein